MMAIWICGLLYSCWYAVTAISGLILARTTCERSRAVGQMFQGILLTFVVGGAYFGRSMTIELGGSVMVGLLIIHALLGQATTSGDATLNGDELV